MANTLEDRERMLAAIPRGRENRMIADKIAKAAAIVDPDWRTQSSTRSIITELIMEGHPICSSSRGYWITDKREEVETYIEEMKSRLLGFQLRIDALEATAAKMGPAPRLFDEKEKP